MTCPLPQRTRTSTRAGSEMFKRRSFPHYRLLDQQGIDLQIGVVFRVGDRALQSLAHHHGRFLRAESQEIERVRGRAALNFSSHFPRFESGDSSITVGGCYLHCLTPDYSATFPVSAPCFFNVPS